jgi:RNA polymerase sigma factor (sigma-70 family)
MRAVSTDVASLVGAAQSGDRHALEELVAIHLPLVYDIVGRGLSGHEDADDVVQETMLRVIRQLDGLREPARFRSWLAAIAVRQVSTYLRGREIAERRTVALEETEGVRDAGADFEDVAILSLGLSGQRRQAVLASRWLDADHRTVLSLWWLELAGQLTRPELAAALGVTAAHANVRVQRMLDQLELSRALTAALAARPGCAELEAVLVGWHGRPDPLWRKRIGRHVRVCARCGRASEGMVAAARLLVGVALVPVPVALTAALVGKNALPGAAAASVGGAASAGGAGVRGALLARVSAALTAHPVAAVAVAAVIAAGAVAAGVQWQPVAPGAAAPAAARGAAASATVAPTGTAPSANPGTDARIVALGPVSLESVDEPGRYIASAGDVGQLAAAGTGAPAGARLAATFEAVEGLADRRCLSLRSRDGRYLRHSSWRLRLMADEGTVLFREDATFCPRAGAEPGSVTLESFNYPGRFLRHLGAELWVDPSDRTASFGADSSFRPAPPLTR